MTKYIQFIIGQIEVKLQSPDQGVWSIPAMGSIPDLVLGGEKNLS